MQSEQSPQISDEAVENATGRNWEAWFALLDKMDASEMSHKEIAARLGDEYGVSGWWAQSITVEFERAIGRREIGQKVSGDFAASASKTLVGDKDSVLASWQGKVGGATGFDGIALASAFEVSKSDNWRYWRATLEDGTKVVVTIGEKSSDKATIQVSHEKLADKDAVQRWKIFWRGVLKDLAA